MCLLEGGYLLLGKGSFIRWGSEWRTRLSQCQNIDSCFGHAVRGACGWIHTSAGPENILGCGKNKRKSQLDSITEYFNEKYMSSVQYSVQTSTPSLIRHVTI